MKPFLSNHSRALLLWCSLLSAASTAAQIPVFRKLEPGGAFSELRLGAVAEDRHGYLWLGADAGLLRFDGIRTERPRSVLPSLEQHKVTALYVDNRGILWAGYKNGLIARLGQDGALRLWEPEEGLPAVTVTGFAESNDGALWISTYGEGLYRYDGRRIHNFNLDDGLPSSDVYTIACDSKGRIWAGTDAGIAVCSFVKDQKKIELLSADQGLPDPIVTVLLSDHLGQIWVGMHDGGVAMYHPEVEQFFCMEMPWTHGIVSALAMLPGRELWIGTEGNGLFRYELGGGGLSRINGEAGLPRSKITALHFGREGHLRVLTNESFLYSANLQIARLNTPAPNVQTVLADSRNRLWIGTPEGLWRRRLYGQATVEWEQLPACKHFNIISLYEDPAGNIWAGTFGQGLFFLPAGTGMPVLLEEQQGLVNNSILGLAGNGRRIWAATLGGVSEYVLDSEDPSEAPFMLRNYHQANGLGANFIYSAFSDSRHRIWFGTDGQGISMLDKDSISQFKSAVTQSNDSLPLHAIYSFAEDRSGKIWFTTAKDGLFSYNGRYFQRHEYADGLKGKGVALIRTDTAGMVLLAHRNGLDLLDPAGTRFFHFEEAAGLSDFDPNLNASTTDRSGQIWIGTSNGLWRYTPLGTARAAYPKTVLNQVSVFLEPIDFQNKNKFSHNENSLVFSYSGIWHTDPERVRYRYRLSGFNSDWIYTADRQATFPNLPHGAYTFEVTAGIDEVFEDSETARYIFVIRKPFWKEGWFLLPFVTALTGLFLWWMRRRDERMRIEEARKKEQAENRLEVLKNQINPHFLFNSFNTLTSLIEEAPDLAVAYVEKLSDFFRNILQYREKDLISLEEELAVLDSYLFLLHKRYGNNLLVEIELQPTEGYIVPLALQLLVENAVKHNIVSASKPLHLRFYAEDDYWVVENSLQPRLSRPDSTGLGLKNIVKRYELLTHKEVRLEQTDHFFRVGIPIIQTDLS